MEKIYLHKVFNLHLQNFQQVIDKVEDKRWKLLWIVTLNEFEYVAIFEREMNKDDLRPIITSEEVKDERDKI